MSAISGLHVTLLEVTDMQENIKAVLLTIFHTFKTKVSLETMTKEKFVSV